jgi:hypothetical protein
MRDIRLRIENTFKDAVVKACAANGIDKSEAGYLVGGFGAIGPVMTPNGIGGFAPAWSFAVELQTLLVGQVNPARLGTLHSVVPADAEIVKLAAQLVAEAVGDRKAQFEGPRPAPLMP